MNWIIFLFRWILSQTHIILHQLLLLHIPCQVFSLRIIILEWIFRPFLPLRMAFLTSCLEISTSTFGLWLNTCLMIFKGDFLSLSKSLIMMILPWFVLEIVGFVHKLFFRLNLRRILYIHILYFFVENRFALIFLLFPLWCLWPFLSNLIKLSLFSCNSWHLFLIHDLIFFIFQTFIPIEIG